MSRARKTAIVSKGQAMPEVASELTESMRTLARDIARLPAYRIASVLAFDMFPQTAHVETVCELVPEHR
mgnify:CR=1 FL=1